MTIGYGHCKCVFNRQPQRFSEVPLIINNQSVDLSAMSVIPYHIHGMSVVFIFLAFIREI